jgi:hypothetical protein
MPLHKLLGFSGTEQDPCQLNEPVKGKDFEQDGLGAIRSSCLKTIQIGVQCTSRQ